MTVKSNYQKNDNGRYRVTATIGKGPEVKPIRKESYSKSQKNPQSQFKIF